MHGRKSPGVPLVDVGAVFLNEIFHCRDKVIRNISDAERNIMEKILDIPVMDGTVNFGMPLVGAGVVSSSNGAVCGQQSTGIELGRIEEALMLF